jgi:transposase
MTSTKCKVNKKGCESVCSAREIMEYFFGIEKVPLYKIQNILFKSDGSMNVILRRKGRCGTCPCCGKRSCRRHSTYVRKIRDIPFGEKSVTIIAVVSKYKCTNPDCHCKVFCEELPFLAGRYARFSLRMNRLIVEQSLDNSSRDASKHLKLMHFEVSPSTCLRRLYPLGDEPSEACGSTYVGIDDFAFCKGKVYMSVVADLFTHRVVAVIPCRSGRELDRWLRKNPQIEVVTRDRGRCFVEALTWCLPNAIQICDRFHLIKNITDTMADEVKGMLKRHTFKIPYQYPSRREAEKYIESSILDMGGSRDREKLHIYWKGMKLRSLGFNNGEIAKRLEVKSQKVRHVLDEMLVDKVLLKRQKTAFLHESELAGYICAGCLSVSILTKKMDGKMDSELIARVTLKLRMEYKARRQAVKEHNRKMENDLDNIKVPAKVIREFILSGVSQNEKLNDLMKLNRDVAGVLAMCVYFRKMIMGDALFNNLDLWINQAMKSPSKALANFAYGIKSDRDAVYNAITLPYSNGLLEGTVNKIKALKRQMYNRAGIRLLRAKLIYNIMYKAA